MEKIVKRVIDDSHYYFVDDEFYPGVTTIIGEAGPTGEGLKHFFLKNTPESAEKIRNEAANFGTEMHEAYEVMLQGAELDLVNTYQTDKAREHIMSFVKWARGFKMKDIETELVIYSKKYRYAGTLDLTFVHYGKRYIVDFKTSSGIYFGHETQLVAYKKAFEELRGEKVDVTAILRTGSRHSVGYEFKEIERPFKHFKNVYNTWLALNDDKMPTIPIKLLKKYPEKIQLWK